MNFKSENSEDSESEDNEILVSESIRRDSIQITKQKYNYDENNNQNFPEDVFSYVNLTLLTFPVNSVNYKQQNLDSLEHVALIKEIYDSFSHLYSLDKCRKALILNNWNPEKTAAFLIDNENEIKQPLLISENSCILFQTKIESVALKNNKIEFKTIKNPIFDTTQYDLLKWSLTKECVMGYKIKEGACVLFDTNPNKTSYFPFSYVEKVKNGNLPNNPAKNALHTKNKSRFNVMWRDSLTEKTNLGNKFFLNEEIEIEKRILESIKQEYLSEAKLNKEIKENYGNSNILQTYLGDSLNNIENNNNIANENVPTKLINSYSIKTKLKPGFSKNFNQTNNCNPTNLIYENNNNPFTANNLRAKDENELIYQMDNTNNQDVTSKLLERVEKKNYADINEKNIEGAKIKNKNKKSKKKVKETIVNSKDELVKKINYLKKSQESINLAQMDNAKPSVIPENIIEEVTVNDVTIGTLIKVVPSLHFSKIDSVFCYDQKNKIYYILNNSSITLNVMVSNTFISDVENYEKVMLGKNSIFAGDTLEKEIENYLMQDQAVNFEEDKDYLNDLFYQLKKLSLVLSKNKQEMPWKYSNWNYFYIHFYEVINMVKNILIFLFYFLNNKIKFV